MGRVSEVLLDVTASIRSTQQEWWAVCDLFTTDVVGISRADSIAFLTLHGTTSSIAAKKAENRMDERFFRLCVVIQRYYRK